ncbi:MAG: hypothetical protein DMF95_33080 [Acidobacteria bacterium]|nr:MAG: hypothetical protein DMF96_10760 [Acidobacteriota bacterium]PYR23488.1 MAG: hypothetical protein DMF94_01225 [Acidobacteriota bacterium]PYR40637.1 MAG: hypothetical protein DMF95_33080 [Acidobacteriota bacterium]
MSLFVLFVSFVFFVVWSLVPNGTLRPETV